MERKSARLPGVSSVSIRIFAFNLGKIGNFGAVVA